MGWIPSLHQGTTKSAWITGRATGNSSSLSSFRKSVTRLADFWIYLLVVLIQSMTSGCKEMWDIYLYIALCQSPSLPNTGSHGGAEWRSMSPEADTLKRGPSAWWKDGGGSSSKPWKLNVITASAVLNICTTAGWRHPVPPPPPVQGDEHGGQDYRDGLGVTVSAPNKDLYSTHRLLFVLCCSGYSNSAPT